MSDQLEDTLRQALGHASEHAMKAPSGLSAHIVARSRRRTMRTQALVAAAAVLVVAGGVGVAVRGGEHRASLPAVGPSAVPSTGNAHSSPVPSAQGATPLTPSALPSAKRPTSARLGSRQASQLVDEVWPDAVWRIPAELPDGRKTQPRIYIDDHTVLLEAQDKSGKSGALYAYDLNGGETRKIADIVLPKGEYPLRYAVGSGRIVWQTIQRGVNKATTRFWSVPTGGGNPQEIETDRPVEEDGYKLVVVGDRLAFSPLDGGVFTIPLGGGAVTPVAGTAGLHILRWPWAGTPGMGARDGKARFQKLVNVETGETSRAIVHSGERQVRCGLTACIGSRADGTWFYRLRDGSGERDLPGQDKIVGFVADRLLTIWRPSREGGEDLLDLRTGKSGDLGLRPDADGSISAPELGSADGRLISYPLGGKYVVIDLSKIS